MADTNRKQNVQNLLDKFVNSSLLEGSKGEFEVYDSGSGGYFKIDETSRESHTLPPRLVNILRPELGGAFSIYIDARDEKECEISIRAFKNSLVREIYDYLDVNYVKKGDIKKIEAYHISGCFIAFTKDNSNIIGLRIFFPFDADDTPTANKQGDTIFKIFKEIIELAEKRIAEGEALECKFDEALTAELIEELCLKCQNLNKLLGHTKFDKNARKSYTYYIASTGGKAAKSDFPHALNKIVSDKNHQFGVLSISFFRAGMICFRMEFVPKHQNGGKKAYEFIRSNSSLYGFDPIFPTYGFSEDKEIRVSMGNVTIDNWKEKINLFAEAVNKILRCF